jgi:hypothetical protein
MNDFKHHTHLSSLSIKNLSIPIRCDKVLKFYIRWPDSVILFNIKSQQRKSQHQLDLIHSKKPTGAKFSKATDATNHA